MQLLAETGVGYLQLGQSSPTLSGGEAQRLKLVTELSTGRGRTATERLRGLKNAKRNLYLIEEPTIGLHMADVKRLIDILHRLGDGGRAFVVNGHHPRPLRKPISKAPSGASPCLPPAGLSPFPQPVL